MAESSSLKQQEAFYASAKTYIVYIDIMAKGFSAQQLSKTEVYDKEIMAETSCFNHPKQNVVHEAIN